MYVHSNTYALFHANNIFLHIHLIINTGILLHCIMHNAKIRVVNGSWLSILHILVAYSDYSFFYRKYNINMYCCLKKCTLH